MLARLIVWGAAAAMLGIGAGPFDRTRSNDEPAIVVTSDPDGALEALSIHDDMAPTDAPKAAVPADDESRTEPARTEARWTSTAKKSSRAATSTKSFGQRLYRPARTVRMRVTAYSPDARSCGTSADGITASGRPVSENGGHLVAADTRLLPFGTLVTIPGYASGTPVPVLDRGGAIKGHRLDVLFPTHERAMQWGVQWLDVTIWEEVADGDAAPRVAHR